MSEITEAQLAEWEQRMAFCTPDPYITCNELSCNEVLLMLATLRAARESAVQYREERDLSLASLDMVMKQIAAWRPVVEAATIHVDHPGEDSYRALIDAVCALRVARDRPE